MSQLPEFRIREVHAFQAVGIDFAGPLLIRTEDKSLKKKYTLHYLRAPQPGPYI